MKAYFSAVILLLLCTAASAQTAQMPQTHKIVYLKDGSNVKGTVTVNDSAGYVMVVDNYNESHYYQKNMVAKIDDEALHQRGYSLKSKGYVCNIELGGTDVLAKDNGSNISVFSFDVVNSYLFSPYFSLGMGLGTELSTSGVNTEMLSLYADSRIYFTRSNISPFLNLAFGYNGMFMKYTLYSNYYYYTSDVAKDGDHGLMCNPSLGIRVAVGRAMALTAGIGYKLYYLHNNGQYYAVTNDNTFRPDGSFYIFHSVSIRAGFQF